MGVKFRKRAQKCIIALTTGLYISYIPAKFAGIKKWTGAGLLGTTEGLILLPFIPRNALGLTLFLVAASLTSAWLCGRAEKLLGVPDDPRIILDELVGFWVAQAFLPRRLWVLIACFVLFRVFDTIKPPPANWLERLPGGWGIIADDIGAGVMANLTVRAALQCWPA